MSRVIPLLALLVACGDNLKTTPESVATGSRDGQQVEVTGEVHTVTFDSVQDPARRKRLANHRDPIEAVLEQDDEEEMGRTPAFDDGPGGYPRKTDRYILIRSARPEGITFGEPGFNSDRLLLGWGLAVHLRDLAPGEEMPEIGSIIKVKGTFHMAAWNQRDTLVPMIDDPTITIVTSAPPLGRAGESCALDQACGNRLVCDRATKKCAVPPREIYWSDPWHDVNGACDTDADCPLDQVCDPSYAISDTGEYRARYIVPPDVGRHLCRLAPGATVASQCPRIYTMRDVVSGRFVTGKEICVRAKLFAAVKAEDGDTHTQMVVDEPIPYPSADAAYNIFGGTTENGPIYKDPALPGGPITDPPMDQEVIAIGTYRYDPGHGWYEVHPVKAYLPAPVN